MSPSNNDCPQIKLSSLPEILARPGQTLNMHITEMFQQIPSLTLRVKPTIKITYQGVEKKVILSKNLFNRYVQLIIAFHDFGKISPYFQQKIHYINQTPGISRLKKECKAYAYHAQTSSILAFYAIFSLIKNRTTFLDQQNSLILDLSESKNTISLEYLLWSDEEPLIGYERDIPEIGNEKEYVAYFLAVAGSLAVLMHHNKDLDDNIEQIESKRIRGLDPEKVITKILISIRNVFIEAKNIGKDLLNEVFKVTGIQQEYLEAIALTIHDTIIHAETEEQISKLMNYLELGVNAFLDEWREKEPIENLTYPLFFNLIYSFLCEVDEWDAKFTEIIKNNKTFFEKPLIHIPENIVEEYKTKKFGSIQAIQNNDSQLEGRELLNFLRETMFHQINNAIEQIDAEQVKKQVYVIDAPTGLGKTLNLLNFGVKLRNKIREKKGIEPRIIYVLPFISIIDQVGEQIFDVLTATTNIIHEKIKQIIAQRKNLSLTESDYIQTEILCLNHHLADSKLIRLRSGDEDTLYQLEDEKVPTDNEIIYEYNSYHLINTWQPDIIVTSFVKFFNTIAKAHKRELIRYHRLMGSIILIDEIQAIPSKYWKLVRETFENLVENFECTIVLASATPPVSLTKLKFLEPQYLFSFEQLPHKINRYYLQLEFLNEKNEIKHHELDEFIKEVMITITQNPEKHVLVVMNTTKSAFQAYKAISQEISKMQKKNRTETFLLSTQVMPVHRIKKIHEIREKTKQKDKQVVLVSTQIIEAGVDLSFDIVFRDFAPLDSIIQVAGRCNRNNENKEPGKVMVYYLKNESGGKYAQQTYHQHAIELGVTKDILLEQFSIKNTEEEKISKEKILPEEKSYQMLKHYFERLDKRKQISELIEEFKNGRFKSMYKCFHIIEEKEYATTLLFHLEENTQFVKKYFYEQKIKHIPNKLRKYVIETNQKNFEKIKEIIPETAYKTIKDKDGKELFHIIHLNQITNKIIYGESFGLNLDL